MLTSVTWTNFKLFREPTTLLFGKITVLCGANGRGKSSALQPILCMAQSRLPEMPSPVRLSGTLTDLGSYHDVRNRETPSDHPIQLHFEFQEGSDALENWAIEMHLIDTLDEPTFLRVAEISLDIPENGGRWSIDHGGLVSEWTGEAWGDWQELSVPANDPLWRHVPFDSVGSRFLVHERLEDNFAIRYISADRLGPQSFVPREVLDGRLSVGPRGQHTIEVLGRVLDQQIRISPDRAAPPPQAEALTVFDQANAWMRHIFDGASIQVQSSDLVRTLRMNADGGAHYARPSNIGYGFTCLLPIIVEGLLTPPGAALIIENPEAHLNPAAVSRFTRFLATLARDRVQIFVETHSEHVVNGLRLAVKDEQLAPEDVSILFFQRSENAPILKVEIDRSGHIPHWPEGFFDTAAHDLARLHGF